MAQLKSARVMLGGLADAVMNASMRQPMASCSARVSTERGHKGLPRRCHRDSLRPREPGRITATEG